MLPATVATARRASRGDGSAAPRQAASDRAAARAAQAAPAPAARQIVGSAGIQCFSAPKIGVVPSRNGPIEAAADSASSSAGAPARRPRSAIQTPAPTTEAASVLVGTVNSVV